MELQQIGNQEIAQKEMVSKFVHDVADMEVRAFTLKEAAKKNRDQASKQLNMAANRLDIAAKQERKAHDTMTRCEACVDRISTYRKYRKETKSAGRFWSEFVTFFFVYGIFAGVASPLLSALCGVIFLGDKFDDFNTSFVWPWLVICFFIYYAIARTWRNSDYKKELQDATSLADSARRAYEKAQKEYELAEKDNCEAETIGPVLCDRIMELEKSVIIMNQKIKECYEIGIIKPAYRNLISLVILDEIFTNDKADTMREAMLLCDTEIRHAELIGKLDQVIHALQALSSTMISVSSVLDGINTNISLISQDVYKMSENQGSIAYAAESLQRSAENTDFYIAQKRAGAL